MDRLIIVQHTEDSTQFTAHIGDHRVTIGADSLEESIVEAKNWATYRRHEYGSVVAYSNQKG